MKLSGDEGRRCALWCAAEQCPCGDEPDVLPLRLVSPSAAVEPQISCWQQHLCSSKAGPGPSSHCYFIICFLFCKSALGIPFADKASAVCLDPHAALWMQIPKQATFRNLMKLKSFGQGSKNVFIFLKTLLFFMHPWSSGCSIQPLDSKVPFAV